MSSRAILGLAAALVLGGGALAFLVLSDSGDSRPRDGGRPGSQEPVRETAAPSDAGGGPDLPIAPLSCASRPADVAPDQAPASRQSLGGGLRPRSIDELRLPPREQGLSGIVRDEKGVEIDGASCELREDLSPDADHVQEGELKHKLTTNGTGIFVFDKSLLISRDRFVLRISHPEYTTEIKSIDATKPAPRVLYVTLRNGTAVAGTVRTVTGKPIAGATVRVYNLKQAGTDPNGLLETSVTTDGEGVFVVKSVTSGPKRITASMEGFATAALPDITLEPANLAANCDFVLDKGSAITGRVWAQDGPAVEGAIVVARSIVGEIEEAIRKGGKGEDRQAKPDPVVRAAPAALPEAEEGADEKRDPNARGSGVSRLQLSPTVKRGSQTLSVHTSADGSYTIEGTEIGPYMMSVTAPGFAKAPEQRVESPATGIVFMLQRDGSAPAAPAVQPETPPPPTPKKH